MTTVRNRRVREGGGGEYDEECRLDNNLDDNEYNNDNRTMMQRMGRGRMGD